MTTTRPYRKAMSVERRCDASRTPPARSSRSAWSTLFVEGIETAEDAPLPGADVGSLRLWTPYGQDRIVA